MDELMATMAIILGVLLLAAAIAMCANYYDFMASSASLEALRVDAANLSEPASEDVIGQITAFNQRIAAMQRLNGSPFVCLFIPNGWDALRPIPVPKRAV